MGLKATRDGFGEGLLEAGRIQRELLVVDCDLGGATKASAFGNEFPDRFLRVGIQEQNGVSFAAGLSLEGNRVFISSFASFLTQQAKSQIMYSMAYSKIPLVLVGSHSGLAIGKDGGTQMGIDDLNTMYGVPDLEIYSPADHIEAREITKYLAEMNTSAYLRTSRRPQPVVHEEDYEFKFNKGEILREGNDLSLFATGDMVYHALESADEIMQYEGIDCEVINFATLNPLDRSTILEKAVRKNGIITLEDHLKDTGFGLRIKGIIAEEGIGTPVTSIGIEGFGESGAPDDLYHKHGMDQEGIIKTIKEFYRGLT